MITTTALSPHIGVEVAGVDFDQPLPAALQQEIRQAWVSSGILLFRGAGTSVEAHLKLSRIFGELQASATRNYNNPENPYVMDLIQDPEKPLYDATAYEIDGEEIFGFVPWHWDQAFMPTIVRGAVLRMIEPPERKGRTGFIDAIGAYERLPEKLKERIDKLEVVYRHATSQEHVHRFDFGYPKSLRILRDVPRSDSASKFLQFPPVVHPLVIVQQETGRKVLKYSPLHTQGILGWDQAESDELLAEVAEYLTDERYAYFHKWGANDMIVWDNWRVIHTACGAPRQIRRYAQRTTIAGDYDLGRYLDPALDKHREVVTFAD